MSNSLYTCNCDVIHEDIVNDVKGKMQPKDDYIQLASLFKLFGDGTRVQILHALEQNFLRLAGSKSFFVAARILAPGYNRKKSLAHCSVKWFGTTNKLF